MNIKETIRAEIERIKKENKCPSIHNDLEFSVWSAKDDLLDNILYLLDSLSEQPVEGLEEAAENRVTENGRFPISEFEELRIRDIKFGAEWMKAKMLEKAVECVVENWNSEPHPEITIPLNPEVFGVGDKVRVIVIKEGEK